MAANLTDQVRNIATVTTAVAQGDLSRKVSANCKGEILKLKETINKMVDRLQNFATEVTKVARYAQLRYYETMGPRLISTQRGRNRREVGWTSKG